MKFSVGYQMREDNRMKYALSKYRDSISEVYFSFGDIPNGRNSTYNDLFPHQAVNKQLSELGDLPLNLLLNGNCYGKYALARSFYNKLGDTISFLSENTNLKSITTTSPLIARFVKENFSLHVRASVNMNIGTVEGMEYVENLFDSFYASRELNRNLEKLLVLRKWCDERGKKLYGLANSGCLKNCSAHTFHDNLVAHEAESSEMDNAYVFKGQCEVFFSDPDKRAQWLRYMTFIRPEDVSLYEGIFDGIKLATRVNNDPFKVIGAYVNGSYSGAITSLLEPDHSPLFYSELIENKKISGDFAETVLKCNKDCSNCDFCKNVQKNATIKL